jgi:hypothetical protein
VESFFADYTETTQEIAKRSQSDKVLEAFAFSHPFMEVTGDLVMAWMLLWRASLAAPQIGKNKKDTAFYQGQVQTARFFINTILPITRGRLEAIRKGDAVAVEMEDAAFGGK